MTTNSKLILHPILRDIYTSLGSHLHQLHNTAPSLVGGRLLPPMRARQQVGPCCRSACGVPGEPGTSHLLVLQCNYYDSLTVCDTITLSHSFILFTLQFSHPHTPIQLYLNISIQNLSIRIISSNIYYYVLCFSLITNICVNTKSNFIW